MLDEGHSPPRTSLPQIQTESTAPPHPPRHAEPNELPDRSWTGPAAYRTRDRCARKSTVSARSGIRLALHEHNLQGARL